MIRRQFIARAVAWSGSVELLLGLHAKGAQNRALNAAENCGILRPESKVDQHVRIEQSGCYVLGQSFDQGWRYVLSEGGRKGPVNREMILTWAKDTEIDLAGHNLRTSTFVDGITADPDRGDEPNPSWWGPTDVHRLAVRDGSMELRHSDGQRSGHGVLSPWEAVFIHQDNRRYPIPTIFRKVAYVLENSTIKTGNAAALLMGDGIVVRNCTIEVEGENALVIYGPHAVIENNRIVYRFSDANPGLITATYLKPAGYHPELRSAIYLRAADNAVVRGNTISVNGWDDPVSAVAVVDSKNVLIVGNRFNRDVTPVVRQGSSSARLRNNEVKEGWLGKYKALPDMDLQ